MKQRNRTQKGDSLETDQSAVTDPDEILPEYDFRGGVRGKYTARYAEGTNVVLLDPDVAEAFPDSEAVNATLRAVAEIARRQGAPSKRRSA